MPVIFKNEGDLPLAAIKTFGVSAKMHDDAIGFFGTGLKYALAILLRLGCRVVIYSGVHGKIVFHSVETEIRGKKFDIVCMNVSGEHVELGFTTELGKTWEPWQAFRELYCNTIDEGGTVDYAEKMPPDCFVIDRKMTMIVVEGAVMDRCWEERHLSFLFTDPIEEGPMANAHTGAGRHIYYRGIRVADLRAHARYDYNVLAHVELTEDRTLKYQFQARHAIASLILASKNREFLRDVLLAPQGTYEFDMDYAETSMAPGETFLDVVGELRVQCEPVNPSATEVHRQHHSRHVLPHESVKLNKVEKQMLERAVRACEGLGCEMDRYRIVVLENLGSGTLGRAENYCLFLSRRVFNMGTKMVAGTLFEEYIHLAERLRDETRDMQNWLIDRLLTLYEEQQGEPL